jgi:hypothetical protein
MPSNKSSIGCTLKVDAKESHSLVYDCISTSNDCRLILASGEILHSEKKDPGLTTEPFAMTFNLTFNLTSQIWSPWAPNFPDACRADPIDGSAVLASKDRLLCTKKHQKTAKPWKTSFNTFINIWVISNLILVHGCPWSPCTREAPDHWRIRVAACTVATRCNTQRKKMHPFVSKRSLGKTLKVRCLPEVWSFYNLLISFICVTVF